MTHGHILRAAFVSFVLSCQWLSAQVFFWRKDFPAGPNPGAVISGDFNGDGRADLAIATNDGIVVYLNTGGSSFGRGILTEASPNLFWLQESKDFNNDNKDDLVGSGFIFLSRGDGTFLPGRYIGAQEAVATADFNGDGKMDLIMSDYDPTGIVKSHGVRVFLGNGDGTFTFGSTLTEAPAIQVRIADFNGDGRPDAALLSMPVSMVPTSTVSIFQSRRDGTLGPGIPTTIEGLSGFLVADFNGDGRPDLFTSGGILMGNGDGTFQTAVPYGKIPLPIAIADFTGDGKADLAISNGLYSVAVLEGKGDGTFSNPPASAERSARWPGAALVADLDGDGRPDLAIAAYTFSNVVTALMARGQDSPAMRRAVSTATGIAIVAPESLASLYAGSIAVTASASPPWPTKLGGVSLEVRDSQGTSRPAPLLYVSPTQINFQVPVGTALGEATLRTLNDSGNPESGSMQVDPLAPGMYTVGNSTPMASAVLVKPDGTHTPLKVYSCLTSGDCGLEAIMLSGAGDGKIYLSLFGTGFHGASSESVTVSASGVRLPVLFAGPQQLAGVDQINVELVPKVLEKLNCEPIWGCDTAFVTIKIGGVPANSFWLWVE